MEFLKQNAGKLGLIAVLLVAAIAVFTLGGDGGPARSSTVQFVCVATGEIFWLERKPRTLPVENPNTGQKTLVPCHESEDGTLSVSRRNHGLIGQLDKDGVNQHVDPETLVVRPAP
jgi:hypothetical protein